MPCFCGFWTAGFLTPWRNRVTATRGLTLTTTVRVIERVHDNTTNRRTLTEVALTTCFTEVLVHVVRVRNRTNRCKAAVHNHAEFTGRQFDLSVAISATDELSVSAS